MTDHCCCRHEHQVAFVADISLDELAQKRKQTLSKLNNSSDRLSLWFFQTSLKRILEKTPQNRKKNTSRLSSLSLLATSSTPNTWNSSLTQLKDTPIQVSTPHIFAFDGLPSNECLDLSLADSTYGSASKITERPSCLQQNVSGPSEFPSLGISLDDSRFSWTSSLATPPGYTAEDASPLADETEPKEEMPKSKTLARALFSPDIEQSTLDDVGQLSKNISKAFKSCDKTPLTIDTQKVLSPTIPFSPVLFESKDTSVILPKHEPERYDNLLSNSLSTSLPSSDPTVGDDKPNPEEISCRSLVTPVDRRRTDGKLHSILSKKKHFSSTPKHVHFSESCLLVSGCDKKTKKFSSADKLRQLRDSSASLSDLTLETMQSEHLGDSNAQMTIGVNKNSSSAEICKANWEKDSFEVCGSQPDKDMSVVETPLSVISQKHHDDNMDEVSTTLAAHRKMEPVAHESHLKPDCKTSPRSLHCSKDESSIHRSSTQFSDIQPTFPVVPDGNLNFNSKSLSSEGPSSVGSCSNNQSCQMNPNSTISPELISSVDNSDDSQMLNKTKEFPGISPKQPNPENVAVPPGNKDDKNIDVFTQLSSSYDEKLISEVDRMSNRDVQEMPVIEPPQIEQCPPKGDNISERKEIDFDCSSSIIDDKAQLSMQNQKDSPGHCTAVMPINSPPGGKPVPSKEIASLSKTTLNNSDTPESSSSSTPKVSISLCGKLRRKSKGFLYPTASQINRTSPMMALNFKVQGMNDNKPNYVTKSTVDQSAPVDQDTTKNNNNKSLEQDLGSDARTLVCKNTESSAKISDFHLTTDKRNEMATMDPLNKGNSQSCSQPKIAVNSSTNFISVESADKMAEGNEVASSNCEEQQETEAMSYCKDSVHESAQPSTTFQSYPLPDTNRNSNNQSPINFCQISECPDAEIHRKTKFYRSQHKTSILESEVHKVNLGEISRTLSSKSEPNSKSPIQHVTLSVVDPKSPELSKKAESKQPISGPPKKELSLIPDSIFNQNPKEAGDIIQKSTTAQNDQEVLEMNLLTASQMVKWEELDNFSETFIEKDDSSSLNILHGQNDQVCSPDPGAYQDVIRVEPKEESLDLAEGGKTKEEEIQNYQTTSKTQMPSITYESHKLSPTENEEQIKVQSPGGFSTARGKQIDVKEESLKKAQNLLSEESIEAQSLEGFSTANGKQISVKEESLEKAQNLLNKESNLLNKESTEVQSLEGFSTPNGKLISVQAESMKKAQNFLNDESIQAQTMGGFSTAGGKQISVKEESLRKAQNLLNEESIDDQSLEGFSTARGKQISVTGESLKKAQKILNDESIEAQSLGGFSTAKGKQISVTGESLKKAQKILNDESVEAQSLESFSTAEGKQISVTGESLKKAQNLLNEGSIEVQSMGGFSTAGGKQINVKEESLKKAQNIFNEELIEAPSKTKEVEDLSESEKGKNWSEDKNDQLELLDTDGKIEPQVKNMGQKLTDETDFLHPNNQTGSTSPTISKDKSPQSENKTGSLNPNFPNNDSRISKFKINENLIIQNKQTAPDLKNPKSLPKGFRPFKAPRMLSNNSINTKSSTLQKYSENEKTESLNEKHIIKGFDINSEKEDNELQEIPNMGSFSTPRGKQISVTGESPKKAQHLPNEESIDDQSLGGFSTARGKQISVTGESLKKAQKILTDESVEAQSLGGFSTARGKQISVTGESLKKAQKILTDESVEAQSLGGFSTARGKQISVTGESLKKAQKILTDESVEAQSLGGFSTARRKQISVTGESLKKAQKILNDESVEAQSVGGFSTARGKQISVTGESLKKAQKILNDESVEAQSLGGFSTARGKQISVTGESLKKAQKILTDESVEAQSLGGFSTARRKQISVTGESLKKAQKILSDESAEAQSLGGFSTARGKQISVTGESLKKAQMILSDELAEAQSLGGFSTARGKQISVTGESLKKAQKILNDESVEAQSLGGFSTARGKQISVTGESLKKAQKILTDESIEAQSLGGFSTARGKQISVTGESLKKAQKILNDESVEAQSLGGFSTARGKQISVTGESLKKAQKILSDESAEAQPLGGFSTARGKQISVTGESLKKAQKILNDESVEAQSLGGFSTARGKQISVTGESLKKAQMILSDELAEDQPLGGFSTARGKQISVTGESLKKAQKILSDESAEAQPLGGFSTARGKQISVTGESLKKAQKILNDESVEAQSLGGFSTARGKQISVTGESLKKAQMILTDESVEAQSLGGFSTARGKQISVTGESLKKAQKILTDESVEAQSLGGFSTARGKQISVTGESLKKAQMILTDESVEAQSLGGFSTARGKQISVTGESLKKAQKILTDESVEAQSLGGFSTARGKQISVTGESLKKAQKILTDESIEAQPLGGFSTAKGKQISVTGESLKKAEKLLSEETLEPPPKYVKSVESFALQDEDVLVEIVDAMDENVVNDLLSTDFTASQMNGGGSSSSKVPIDGSNTCKDPTPTCTLAKEKEVANNYNHLLEDIFNCSWEDDSSTLSKKMQSSSSSVHPLNKLKRPVSEMSSVESGSTKKKLRIDDAENGSSLWVCSESSENNSDVDKPCVLALPISNKELAKFSKSQDISDDVLMQSVGIYENPPGDDSRIVSEDPKTKSGCDSKDQYLNDSDCSNESEMALAVEQLEGERKCSEISGRSTKQQSVDANQMTDHKISSSSGDEADHSSDHSHHKFTPGNEKSCEVNSAIKPISGETIECPQRKNPTKEDMDKNNENGLHDQFKEDSKDNSCSYQNHSFELPSGKLPMDTSGETSHNHQERDSGTSQIASGFQTCLGQKVHVSNESHQKAVELLNSTSENRTQDVQPKTFAAFQTGLGKTVHVSEKALHEAVKTLNKQTHPEESQTPKATFIAFQTARGKDVSVSEKSVNKARQILDAEDPNESDPACSKAKYRRDQAPKEGEPQTFIPFQTARGKDVPVSEKSVNKARRILDTENPNETDPKCSKAKYVQKETPSFGPALHHKSEDWPHTNPQIDSDANSVPSTFKSLQHETNKINLLNQKQNSISWKPCMSTPEADRSGISPVLSDPIEILSDLSFGSKQHSFSDLISRNPLDIEQRVQEKTLEKNGQDVSSRKADFKTPYRKTPAISEVQEAVKVFPRISRPVFKGYGTLPNSPHEEFPKYPNSNLTSSTSRNLNNPALCNLKRQSDRVKKKEPRKENQMSRNVPCSNDSLSSHAAASKADNSIKKSHLQESCDRNQNTNPLSTKSSVLKSSTFLPKSSDCKQFHKEEISKKKVASLLETKAGSVPDDPDVEGSRNKHSIAENEQISKKEVPSLEKNKLGSVSDDPNADGLSNKDPIPEIKEDLSDQFQKKNQEEMPDISRNAPCQVSSEDNSSGREESSMSLKNIDKNPESDKQSEPESAESLCREESHLEEGRLEQDMIVLRNKRKKILPQMGILTRRKTTKKQMKLSDLLGGIDVSSFLPEQFFNYGIHRSTLKITSANAADYRFQLSAFNNANCLHRIIIGDGAILVPDSKSTAGKEEFFRAFQTIEGVDPKLLSPQWLFNHYRWIIWKLAAYEVALPQYFGGRCLTPEMVALQLKFRYDREIDKCQRPALRRIIERDDTPAKRMVLCVSEISQDLKVSAADPATTTVQPLANLEVTDGWYSTKLFLDGRHLSFLVSTGKLRIGQKLCISNAELVGSDTACSPLDCPESIGLKVSGNCCRPARWDAKLGYQADPRPLCLPLIQIAADGGLVGCVDVIVTRIYPVRYMEKVPGGGSVFRTSRAENRQEQRHAVLRQEAAEKLYSQLQASIESTLPKQGPKRSKNWSREEIRQLDNGQDIYEAMTCAIQPDALLNCLSESQLAMLADYKRIAEDLKAQKMKDEFQKAISNEEHAGLKRNVTTVMKVRLVGCSHIDRRNKTSTILTIWRPSEDLQQMLEEGQRYHIYNVMPSPARCDKIFQFKVPSLPLPTKLERSFFLGGLDVHLSITRSTHYECLKRLPSIPQDLFHPRKISSAVELQINSAHEDHLEVDVIGIVLRITKTVSTNQRKHELLHAVDIEGNIFALRFWGGLQIFSVDDLLLDDVVFAGLNLLLRHPSSQRGSSIPILDVYSEVSHFSVNPQQDHLKDSINQLHKLKASEEFLAKSKEKLDSLLNLEKSSLIPAKTSSTSDVSTEFDEASEKQKMVQHTKCVKLLAYGSAPSLSPLSARVPSTVRKAFKPPSITKPKNN